MRQSPTQLQQAAKRVRDKSQNHHDCRQNIPWLLWNALLATPYISEHYKYMFLVARDLYEMFVVYRGKHTTRHSTIGILSEVRVYHALVHEYTVGWRSAVGQVSRQPALDVLIFSLHILYFSIEILINHLNILPRKANILMKKHWKFDCLLTDLIFAKITFLFN